MVEKDKIKEKKNIRSKLASIAPVPRLLNLKRTQLESGVSLQGSQQLNAVQHKTMIFLYLMVNKK